MRPVAADGRARCGDSGERVQCNVADFTKFLQQVSSVQQSFDGALELLLDSIGAQEAEAEQEWQEQGEFAACSTPREIPLTPRGSTRRHIRNMSATASQLSRQHVLLQRARDCFHHIMTLCYAQWGVLPLAIPPLCITMSPTQVYIVLHTCAFLLIQTDVSYAGVSTPDPPEQPGVTLFAGLCTERKGTPAADTSKHYAWAEEIIRVLRESFPTISSSILLSAWAEITLFHNVERALEMLKPLTCDSCNAARSCRASSDYICEPDRLNLYALAHLFSGQSAVAAGYATDAITAAQRLRDTPKGWVTSRGSKALAFAYLIRAESRRGFEESVPAEEPGWIADVKRAVKECEGAKFYAGESICQENKLCVAKLVAEFCGSVCIALRTEFDNADYFADFSGTAPSTNVSLDAPTARVDMWHRLYHAMGSAWFRPFERDGARINITDPVSGVSRQENLRAPMDCRFDAFAANVRSIPHRFDPSDMNPIARPTHKSTNRAVPVAKNSDTEKETMSSSKQEGSAIPTRPLVSPRGTPASSQHQLKPSESPRQTAAPVSTPSAPHTATVRAVPDPPPLPTATQSVHEAAPPLVHARSCATLNTKVPSSQQLRRSSVQQPSHKAASVPLRAPRLPIDVSHILASASGVILVAACINLYQRRRALERQRAKVAREEQRERRKQLDQLYHPEQLFRKSLIPKPPRPQSAAPKREKLSTNQTIDEAKKRMRPQSAPALRKTILEDGQQKEATKPVSVAVTGAVPSRAARPLSAHISLPPRHQRLPPDKTINSHDCDEIVDDDDDELLSISGDAEVVA